MGGERGLRAERSEGREREETEGGEKRGEILKGEEKD